MMEWLVVWLAATVVMACIYGAVKFSVGVYQDYTTSKERAAQAEAQKVNAEQMLLACLRGGVVGRTETGEYIGCQGANSFRM